MASPESNPSESAEKATRFDFYFSEKQKSVIEDIGGGEGTENFRVPSTECFVKGIEFTDRVKAGEKPSGTWDDYRLVCEGGTEKDVEYK